MATIPPQQAARASDRPSRGPGRLVRSSVGALAATILLTSALAAPALAAKGDPKLRDASVSPRTGTTETRFRFEVTYRRGDAPDRVTVVVGGVAHPMAAGGDAGHKDILFVLETRLPAGSHAVRFEAVDRDGDHVDIDAGRLTVATAVTRPRPTPERAPPRPQPTAERTRPKPQPTPERGRPGPDRQTTTPGGSATPDPDATSGGPAAGPDGSSGGHPPAGGGGPTNPATHSVRDIAPVGTGSTGGQVAPATGGEPGDGLPDAASPDGSPAGGDGQTWGELTRYIEGLGLTGTTTPTVRMLPAVVGAAGGVALLMAFMFFGKRRRDGEPPAPDEVLSNDAAQGSGQVADASLTVARPALEGEMALPRWRRPSLLEARKNDPTRSTAAAQKLSFAQGAVGPIDGHERRLIRYRVVRLLDEPDELRGNETGVLVQGDEVQLIERSGTYWWVLCPDGREGWIHRMTLGDVVGQPAAPTAKEAWASSSPTEDIDDDVLTAFMTARGRA